MASKSILKYISVAVVSCALGVGIGYCAFRHAGFLSQDDVSAQFERLRIDSENIPISGSPVKGALQPKAVIVVFVDFNAPGAKLLHEKLFDTVFEMHKNEAAVVYKSYPIKTSPDSGLRAQAAVAAQMQNKYWEMADELFALSGVPFDKPAALVLAKKLHLDIDQFEQDLESRTVREMIRTDIGIAQKLGVDASPFVFINGKKVEFHDNSADKDLLSALNAEIQKTDRMKAEPGFYYYAASGLNKSAEMQEKSILAAMNPGIQETSGALPDDKERRTFVDISGTPLIGAPECPVTIVEFTDFDCAECAVLNAGLHSLMSQYPQKIRLVFKHNPQAGHEAAHRAAEAASLMGNFWGMHDLLFDSQKFDRDALMQYAVKMGLDIEHFPAIMESDNVINRIEADKRQAASVDVHSVPALFINGRRMKSNVTMDELRRVVEYEIQLADKYLKNGTPADDLYKSMISGENAANFGETAEPEEPFVPIMLEQGNSFARGPENAPVVIFMFSEFQCPFCQKVAPTIRQIEEIYGDKVRIVFKNFPLDFHKDAKLASEAAMAAGEQGKFWEMYEILFKNQKNLTRPALDEYAKWAGLDVEKFDEALNSHKFAEQVNQEIQEGKTAGIAGTPAFVINGKLILGAKSLAAFQSEIDAALKK